MENGQFNAIRSEMSQGFASVGQRIAAIENELHRHQDDDREDMKAIRGDVSILASEQDRQTGRIEGALGTLKWMLGVPAVFAAIASILNLLRHW